MADRFTDRVADLAGQTTRVLTQIAMVVEESGLLAQASTLRDISKLHAQIAIDCLIETQPIELERYNLPQRIAKAIEEVEEISADLMSRGRSGHSEMSDAAALITQALHQQSDE